MSVTYSNSRQEEFSALVEKLETIGWRPAGVARALGVSKATVSNILSGKQTPRIPTLDSLRNIVKGEISPEVIDSTQPTLDEIYQQLVTLSKRDPAAFSAARATIQAFYERVVGRVGRTSSKPLNDAQQILKTAGDKWDREHS